MKTSQVGSQFAKCERVSFVELSSAVINFFLFSLSASAGVQVQPKAAYLTATRTLHTFAQKANSCGSVSNTSTLFFIK